MTDANDRVLLVLSDFRDERCGVGTSEAVVADLAQVLVRDLDPVPGSLIAFLRAARRGAHGARGAVLAYPTVAQVERVRLVPRVLLLRVLLGRRRWLRIHLHEFEKLRRRHRIAVAMLVGAVADKVVVSSATEAGALRARYRGWAGRSEVAVVPPANGSAPTGEVAVTAGAPEAEGRVPLTVGVLGQSRPDKGQPWLIDLLAQLDPRFGRLEIIGRGWDPSTWPAEVLARYEVVAYGHLPAEEVSARVAAWDLAIAPYDYAPNDGRLSLRTPLAYGVPTLTRGPRPGDLQLRAPHLLFHDEVDLASLPRFDAATRRTGAEAVAALERRWRAELIDELFGP